MKIAPLLQRKQADGKLALQIADISLHFRSLQDFKFSVEARVAVPARRVLAMVKLSPEDLVKESTAIKNIERHLLSVLSRGSGAGDGLRTRIRAIRPSMFSHDNQWNEIFTALREDDKSLENYRRIALIKYVQYLAARQEIVRGLYREKKRLMKMREVAAEAAHDEPVGSGTAMATPLVDRTNLGATSTKGQGPRLKRLPKGESITINLGEGEKMAIFLSRHRCCLMGGNPMRFSDQANRDYNLTTGKTTIGRDLGCDIIMDGNLRDISRVHLIVVINEPNKVHVTDMSSHGTLLDGEQQGGH